MKILVFGAGDYYQRYKHFFIDEVIGLIDNNEQKQGTFLDGKKVMAPEQAIAMEYDRIYVLSVFYEDMTRQLLNLGVERKKIFSPTEVAGLLKKEGSKLPINVISADRVDMIPAGDGKHILMLTPDLKLNGAVVALLGAVRVCLKKGYEVTVGAIQNGAAADILARQYGVRIVIDENLLIHTMAETKWVQHYQVILCNTVLMYQFLSERENRIPIIWWMHDPPYVYKTIDHDITKKIDFSNILVFGAGRIAKEAFEAEFPKVQAQILQYGLEDKPGWKRETKNYFTFLTVGEIQDWKGQDLFCEAARRLLKDIDQNILRYRHVRDIRFLLAGNDSTKFAMKLKEDYASVPEIQFVGVLSRAEMSAIYNNADIYVCPSREETMSITVGEAMMKEVPCIISNAAGISEFIDNSKNGILFQSGDADELFEKMKWCLENRNKAEEVGRKGRNVFTEHFSETVFEEHFAEILRKLIPGSSNCFKQSTS